MSNLVGRGGHEALQAVSLLFLIRLAALATLLEARSLNGDADIESTLIKPATVVLLFEFLGRFGILESNCDDALGLLVVDGNIGDFAMLIALGSHVIDNVEDLLGIVLKLGESEGMLDDGDLLPLALLGCIGFGGLIFVIGPFGKLAGG